MIVVSKALVEEVKKQEVLDSIRRKFGIKVARQVRKERSWAQNHMKYESDKSYRRSEGRTMVSGLSYHWSKVLYYSKKI